MRINSMLNVCCSRNLRLSWSVKSSLKRFATSTCSNDTRKECSWKQLCERHFNKSDGSNNYMAAYYSPSDVEKGYVKKFNDRKNSPSNVFSMILPPPNVTGSLHLGHVFTLAIQDAVAIWNQMNGKAVNWVPGCDHAGIATQVRVEQLLSKSQQLQRHQIDPQELFDHTLKWKCIQEEEIFNQIVSFGSTLNFEKSYFTLDSKMTKSVVEAFIKLYDSNLIYRKSSLVNWCCHIKSAISDIEVDHVPVDGPTDIPVPGYDIPVKFGYLYYFSYKIEDTDSEITVTTTRPETILGVTAVAVHPNDHRYSDFHNRFVRNPFTNSVIPVVLDETIDREFGTGAVMISPAHDFNDYELGIKHNLDFVNVFDDEGKINLSKTEFSGLKRFIVREKIVQALENLSLLKEIVPHKMVVPVSSRSGEVIEPRLKPQWYLKCDGMAEKAADCVKTGELELIPKRQEAVWFEWLKKINDWCLSKQLTWGHRIPAYKVVHPTISEETWVCGRDIEEAAHKATDKCGIKINTEMLKQDSDVLDTWFSAALIPAVAFGWPEMNTMEFRNNYPLSLMETGCDILFLWVVKMAMLCQQLTGQLPFKKVLLHGIIVDAKNKKMSKSLGNGINPEDVTKGATLQKLQARLDESVKLGYMNDNQADDAKKSLGTEFPNGITECGSDGLRFFLLTHNIQNERISINSKNMIRSRQLGKKIWQIARFTMSIHEKHPQKMQSLDISRLSRIEQWMLHQTAELVLSTNQNFPQYQLHLVCKNLKQFWFNNLSRVFLKCIKPTIYGDDLDKMHAAYSVLLTCLRMGLLCSTPMIPYICNVLHHKLPKYDIQDGVQDIREDRYPSPEQWKKYINSELADEMQEIMRTVRIIRNFKQEVTGKIKSVCICTKDSEKLSQYESHLDHIRILTKVKNIDIINSDPAQLETNVLKLSTYNVDIYVNVEEVQAADTAKWIQNLKQKRLNLEKKLRKIEKVVDDVKFQAKAPKNVRLQKNETHLKLKFELQGIAEVLKNLEN